MPKKTGLSQIYNEFGESPGSVSDILAIAYVDATHMLTMGFFFLLIGYCGCLLG